MANARKYPLKPERGLTIVAGVSAPGSISKVMRDLALTTRDAGFPVQIYDPGATEDAAQTGRVSKLLYPFRFQPPCLPSRGEIRKKFGILPQSVVDWMGSLRIASLRNILWTMCAFTVFNTIGAALVCWSGSKNTSHANPQGGKQRDHNQN